jgi:hypothetical protein
MEPTEFIPSAFSGAGWACAGANGVGPVAPHLPPVSLPVREEQRTPAHDGPETSVWENESLADRFLDIELELSAALAELDLSGTNVTHVSNPLCHAIVPHTEFVRRYLGPGRKYLFLGMNPGPWGMCQTGVPFGEVSLSL